MSVEIHWCEGCRSSIPEPDLASGAARPVAGLLLCRACAAEGSLRPAPAPPSFARVWIVPAAAIALAAFALFEAVRIRAELARTEPDRSIESRVAALSRDVDRVAAAASRPAASADAPLAAELEALLAALRDRLDTAVRDAAASVRREAAAREALEARAAAAEARIATLQALIADLADRLAAESDRRAAASPAPTLPPPPLPTAPASRPSSAPAPTVPDAPPPAPTPTVVPAALDPELQALAARLKDPAAGVRFTAVVALGGSKSAAAVELLVAAVRDRESYVRDAAVRALRRTGSLDAVPAVLRALRDTDEFVRWSARDTLRVLTGTTLPFDPSAAQSDREAKARALEQWWAKESEKRIVPASSEGR